MEDEKTYQEQEVWSAIRYLDPDEKDRDKDRVGNVRVDNIAVTIPIFALVLIVYVVWVLLCFRGV